MKKNILKNVGLLILGFVMGGAVVGAMMQSKDVETQKVLDFSRSKMVEFNKGYNEMVNSVVYYAIEKNDGYATVAAQTLQHLTPELIELNKALRLDCKEYQENGKPLMVKDENGVENPLEKLPEEVRIIE